MNHRAFNREQREVDLEPKYKKLFNRSAIACPLFGVLSLAFVILSQELVKYQRLLDFATCVSLVAFLVFLGRLIYYSYKRDE